jgi:hypothetical protein
MCPDEIYLRTLICSLLICRHVAKFTSDLLVAEAVDSSQLPLMFC